MLGALRACLLPGMYEQGTGKIRQWLLRSNTWLSDRLYTQCSVLKDRSSSSLPFQYRLHTPSPYQSSCLSSPGISLWVCYGEGHVHRTNKKSTWKLKKQTKKNLASVFQKRKDSLWQSHQCTLTPTCWVLCNHREHHRNFENTYPEEALCLLEVQQELLITVPQKAQPASMEANPSQNKVLPSEKGIFGP